MKTKRILVVILKDDYGDAKRGSSYEYTYFYKSLSDLATKVRLFDFGPYLNNTDQLQIDLLKAADEFQPDLIFFTLYQNQFTFKTLDLLKEKYLTINWFCDDQWRFDDFSSKYCHHFSYVVTTDPYAVQKYERIGYPNAILSQWAARESLPSLDLDNVEYLHDVTFIGGINPFRQWFVRQLKSRSVNIQAFGSGWPNGRVTYQQMNDIFRQSRINLNISNSKNYDLRFITSSWKNFESFRTSSKNKEQMKGRHFEIPAFGGFQLSNYVDFLEDYYTIGKEIAIYNTIDDLADKIRYYLDHEDLRRSITLAGFKRTRHEHLYSHRFQKLWQEIQRREITRFSVRRIELHDELFPQARSVHYTSTKLPKTVLQFDRQHPADVAVFTDRNMNDVGQSRAAHKIAWLVESRDLHAAIYDRMHDPAVHTKFEAVLTYDQSLLDLGARFHRYLFGGCWIERPDRHIYSKQKNVSIIASKKRTLAGHKLRHEVVEKFYSLIDDVLGNGYVTLANKVDGLRPYRYSIVIENCRELNYFTEKLIDCFATGTVPIYWGCPNAGDFFDRAGIIPFTTIEELTTIFSSIGEADYQSRLTAIHKNFEAVPKYETIEQDALRLIDELYS